MKSGRSPNYRLKRPVHVGDVVLPVGAFVRPIEFHYVPKDTLERLHFEEWRAAVAVVCYTRLGMVVIERDYIEEV